MEQTELLREILGELKKMNVQLGNIAGAGGMFSKGTGGSNDEPLDSDTPRGGWCDIVIKFGKHKGKQLQHVPKDYLKWLVENSDRRGDHSPFHDALDEYAELAGLVRMSGGGWKRKKDPEPEPDPGFDTDTPDSSGDMGDDVPF